MKYFFSYIWAIVWAIIMLVLMFIPSEDLPDTNQFALFYGFDKVVHLGIFFVLTVLLYWESSLKSNWKANKLVTISKVMISTISFGVFTEMGQQYFTNSRAGDKWDLFADITGICMGTFAYILLYRKNRNHEK